MPSAIATAVASTEYWSGNPSGFSEAQGLQNLVLLQIAQMVCPAEAAQIGSLGHGVGIPAKGHQGYTTEHSQ